MGLALGCLRKLDKVNINRRLIRGGVVRPVSYWPVRMRDSSGCSQARYLEHEAAGSSSLG